MSIRTEEETLDAPRARVNGPLAVYLDMLDTHAAVDVEASEEGGPPVGHAFLLAPVALTVLVLGRSEIAALAIVGVMVLWVLSASSYYWRARRRHRIAMGLPAGAAKRYWIHAGLRALLFTGLYVGLQLLIRHFG